MEALRATMRLTLVDELRQWMEGLEGPLGYLVLSLSSWIEYVAPPFPGDAVALFGVFLAVSAGYSVIGVYLALTAGSIVGGVFTWAFGRWLAVREERWPEWLRRESFQRRLAKVRRRYDRHGHWVLASNRFVPALRAFFFVGAGLSGMPLRSVILWGGLSAALWNGLLLGLGFAVGENLERLEAIYESYTQVVLIGLGVLLLGALAVGLWRRRSGDR